MSVRVLNTSTALSPSVTNIKVLSAEDEEMLDVITASKSEGSAFVPAFPSPTVPATTVLCESVVTSQTPCSIPVEVQEDDIIADISGVIAGGETSSDHISIAAIIYPSKMTRF
jgi:hypothetical protein